MNEEFGVLLKLVVVGLAGAIYYRRLIGRGVPALPAASARAWKNARRFELITILLAPLLPIAAVFLLVRGAGSWAGYLAVGGVLFGGAFVGLARIRRATLEEGKE